ncbi:MAG: hypothetical protein AAF720_08720 [Pseudomonadota bacterium]
MRLGVFSTVGEALNFATRRYETVMRVAWLPVTFLFIGNIAFVFGVFSIRAERLITFADIRPGAFEGLAQVANGIAISQAFAGSAAFIVITLASIILQALLIASYMAPLIRLKGIGEEPAPGVVRISAGPDPLRYIAGQVLSIVGVAMIVAPLALSFFYIGNEIQSALQQIFVAFPNAESLHQIEYRDTRSVLSDQGKIWFLDFGAWYFIALLGAGMLTAVITFHFFEAGTGLIQSVITAIAILVGLTAGFYFLSDISTSPLSNPDTPLILVRLYGISLLVYIGLRLFPYSGIAVCRRSMGLFSVLKITRGWNLLRLVGIFIVFVVAFAIANFLLFSIAVPAARTTVVALFQMSNVMGRLSNGGEELTWMLPFFNFLWSVISIVVRYLWLFLSIGATAGLLGSLYRQSVISST